MNWQKNQPYLVGVGVVLVLLDLGLISFFFTDEGPGDAPPDRLVQFATAYVGVVALAQVWATIWAGSIVIALRDRTNYQ